MSDMGKLLDYVKFKELCVLLSFHLTFIYLLICMNSSVKQAYILNIMLSKGPMYYRRKML